MADKKTLSEFARRAAQRLKDRQVSIKFGVKVPGYDEEWTFRTLLDDEFLEIMDMDEAGDSRLQDKYTVYTAAVEPNLVQLANELMEAGEISEPLQVMRMFSISEMTALAHMVLEKSGVVGGEKPRLLEKVAETVKN